MLYNESEEHLVNLDRCTSRAERRAYLTLLLGITAAGYSLAARRKGGASEIKIGDDRGRQLFALCVDFGLRFEIRRPALAADPELPIEARARFGIPVPADIREVTEIHIGIRDERDADALVDWLFAPVIPEYAERRSA